MKNPLVTTMLSAQLVTTPQSLKLLDKDEPTFLAGVLTFLKYTPAEIDRMEKFVDTVGKLASTVSWVIGAVTTVKDLLVKLEVLEPDKAAEQAQKDLALKVDAMYQYLLNTAKKEQFLLAVKWRSNVQQTLTSLANLSLSRSQNNMDELVEAGRVLMTEGLRPMLAPGMGEIPFIRKTYGGMPSPVVYVNQLPDHWTAYALPMWMQTTKGEPASLTLSMDLATTIWDIGFYIDVLIEGIGVRLAALAAAEPAFRSTAWGREDLRQIHDGLTKIVARWEESLFKTTIIGPIDPLPVWAGLPDHRIYHPWIGVPETFGAGATQPGLPLGVIDPVSGISAFDPAWRDGLALHFTLQNFWVVQNYQQAVDSAYTLQSTMLALVREHCGVKRLRELRDHVFALIGPPSPSEFVTLPDVTFSREDITGTRTGIQSVSWAPADEQVDLGVIGQFAGKPNKKYKAKRGFQDCIKRFRVTMARRMDVSKIQLGYRLRFTIGHALPIFADPAVNVNAVLAEYSSSAHPEQPLPLFPSTPQEHELQSDHAVVYDVLQSEAFSAQEEDLFENTGSMPGKQRLFLNPRSGKVSARVKISFELDLQNPDHPFVGFAHVTVGTLDPMTARNGFILSITVYEKKVLATPGDEVREDTVASMTLHVAPSFLVVEPDYFKDREAGLAALEKGVDAVEDDYKRAKFRLGPLEPITKIQRVSEEQALVIRTYSDYAARSPEGARTLADRFAIPALRRE